MQAETTARPRGAVKKGAARSAAAGVARRRGGWRGALKLVLLVGAAGVAVGVAGGRLFAPRWHDYAAPEGDFRAEFPVKPVSFHAPAPEEWPGQTMLVVTSKTPGGANEITRIGEARRADDDRRWMELTLTKINAERAEGDPGDFTAHLPADDVWLRGRVIFSPGGGRLYRVIVLRKTREELAWPSAVRFLYGVKLR